MPRSAKRDVPVSRLLYRNGIFADKRSFVSLNANEPHLFLFSADKSARNLDALLKRAGKAIGWDHESTEGRYGQ